ncbi:Non-classical arabinogalactan protein 30 [Linum perenne]
METKNHITAAAICSLILILLPFMAADEQHVTAPKKKISEVVVEGVVYCQSCHNSGSWSLSGANPLHSATVSVICKNSHKQVSFYKTYQTNEYGYFYAHLDGFKLGHGILDHPLQACNVKLVSSPLQSCNIPTNLNYGIKGAKLRFENKVIRSPQYEAVIYAAGPLAFRPSECPAPEEDVHA